MDSHKYRLSDYDFDLPAELLAEYPSQKRDESRLMVVHRSSGKIEHRRFSDLPEYLSSGDAMVINNTRVIPARLQARRNNLQDGAHIEILLLEQNPENGFEWKAILGNAKRLKVGDSLLFDKMSFYAEYLGIADGREHWIRFHTEMELSELRDKIFSIGKMPLPPYIQREAEEMDRERYQTVYAKEEGAVAAPTAGLHFTPELLDEVRDKGVSLENVTLHVGLGTFTPIVEEDVRDHHMHGEWYSIPEVTAERINSVDRSRNRVICVGTTSVRTLESAALNNGSIKAGSQVTDIYIYPPYKFKAVDALITNFHTPKSTLLLMISAFMGYDLMKKAYAEAIDQRYRFFSYGDSMLIL